MRLDLSAVILYQTSYNWVIMVNVRFSRKKIFYYYYYYHYAWRYKEDCWQNNSIRPYALHYSMQWLIGMHQGRSMCKYFIHSCKQKVNESNNGDIISISCNQRWKVWIISPFSVSTGILSRHTYDAFLGMDKKDESMEPTEFVSI